MNLSKLYKLIFKIAFVSHTLSKSLIARADRIFDKVYNFLYYTLVISKKIKDIFSNHIIFSKIKGG